MKLSLIHICTLRHRGEDRGQDLSQEGHDIAVVGDEAHLGVPGEVLGEVAGGVMRFGSKNGRRRVDPFIHPHHRLLVELGGQSPVVGMAPAEGSVVQQSRQLDLKLGPPQLKGQCSCRPGQKLSLIHIFQAPERVEIRGDNEHG